MSESIFYPTGWQFGILSKAQINTRDPYLAFNIGELDLITIPRKKMWGF